VLTESEKILILDKTVLPMIQEVAVIANVMITVFKMALPLLTTVIQLTTLQRTSPLTLRRKVLPSYQ
jgi:hypothetical protein